MPRDGDAFEVEAVDFDFSFGCYPRIVQSGKVRVSKTYHYSLQQSETAFLLSPHNQGYYLAVSNEHAHLFDGGTGWGVHYGHSGTYATRRRRASDPKGTPSTVLAHRLIMNILQTPKLVADHYVMRIGLVCTNWNLRPSTVRSNLLTRGAFGAVGYSGVSKVQTECAGGVVKTSFSARVRVGLGEMKPYYRVFRTPEEAARARDDELVERLLALNVHPTFIPAMLNFPDRHARRLGVLSVEIGQQEQTDLLVKGVVSPFQFNSLSSAGSEVPF